MTFDFYLSLLLLKLVGFRRTLLLKENAKAEKCDSCKCESCFYLKIGITIILLSLQVVFDLSVQVLSVTFLYLPTQSMDLRGEQSGPEKTFIHTGAECRSVQTEIRLCSALKNVRHISQEHNFQIQETILFQSIQSMTQD